MIVRKTSNPSLLLRIGMAFLLVALVLPRFVHPAAGAGPDWFDGVRGLLFGLGIGFNLLSIKARRPSASS